MWIRHRKRLDVHPYNVLGIDVATEPSTPLYTIGYGTSIGGSTTCLSPLTTGDRERWA
jgi:hypothetical protein